MQHPVYRHLVYASIDIRPMDVACMPLRPDVAGVLGTGRDVSEVISSSGDHQGGCRVDVDITSETGQRMQSQSASRAQWHGLLLACKNQSKILLSARHDHNRTPDVRRGHANTRMQHLQHRPGVGMAARVEMARGHGVSGRKQRFRGHSSRGNKGTAATLIDSTRTLPLAVL